MKSEITNIDNAFLEEISSLVQEARNTANSAVSSIIVITYWNIGRRIVEQEQKGNDRADYGEQLMDYLSAELTRKFGTGFGKRNIQYFRKFYLLFKDFERGCPISSFRSGH